MYRPAAILVILLLVACQYEHESQSYPTFPIAPSLTETDEEAALEVARLSFNVESPLILTEEEEVALSLSGTWSNGLAFSDMTQTVIWFSNDSGIATVFADGRLIAKSPGRTSLMATLRNKTVRLDIIVEAKPEAPPLPPASQPSESSEPAQEPPESEPAPEEEPEEPEEEEESEDSIEIAPEAADNDADYFLSSNDVLTMRYGENSGYGKHLFPSIVYGLPWTGGTHVISFGSGGSLLIELHGYIVVNGPGVDFTIFENPFYDTWDGSDILFSERARVSVGMTKETLRTFDCDSTDYDAQEYRGCAGVTPVNAMENPLDPSVSGGDQFDLAQLGLSEVRYIKIDDLRTCAPGDPIYDLLYYGDPYCEYPGSEGFDLDAVAIVNGRNDT